MKKSKKIISLLLSILMIITSIPLMAVNSFATECFTSGDYQYTVLDDGTAKITRYTGSATELTIPSEIDGHSVTSIGYQAFYGTVYYNDESNWDNGILYIGNHLIEAKSDISGSVEIKQGTKMIAVGAFLRCKSLTGITIPDSVTSISDSAFSCCSSLTSITIPDSVINIGSYAFEDCKSLTSITIPDSVTSIGSRTFYNCTSLTSITIPNSVTSIGDYAFSDCTSLTSITIPNSVTSIRDDAFSDCTSLTSITIPDSVTSIGSHAFCGCTSLTEISVNSKNANYSSENGMLFNKDKTMLICYPAGKKDSSYSIPDSVINIGSYAFENCKSLTSITIPDSVTSIGGAAFRYCKSLTSITIPDSVTSIGGSAFSDCTSLTSITIPDSVTSISVGAFLRCKSLTSITIPDSVTSIGWGAFLDCTSLTSITVPDGVTSIGVAAFRYCKSLTSITIPDSVTSIGQYAFYDTAYYNDESNWENGILYMGNHLIDAKEDISGNVSIKQETKTIAGEAFSGCTSLTSISIPNSVTSIGSGAFLDCSVLTNITIPDNVMSIGSNIFEGTAYYNDESNWDNGILYFNDYLLVTKRNVSGSAEIKHGTKIVADYAFSDCTSLTSITIPNSVTSIGDYAFWYCTSFTNITIPDSVTSIGEGAFSGCTSLTEINVSSENKNYNSENNVLFNKNKTKLIQYPIGTKDTSYTIPDSVTSIETGAFYHCKSLTSITIPDSVTHISEKALGYYYYDDEKIDGFTIYGYTGSEAERYANENGFKFVAIGDAPTMTFPDVASGDWYYNAVRFNVEKGYVTGYSNGTFGPANNIQRQDFVLILARIAGADLSAYEGKNGGFSDVPTNAYYSAAVAWAKDKGIVTGYSADNFGVGTYISREQISLILCRYLNGSASGDVDTILNAYSDGGNTSPWAKAGVAWAVENGIIGNSDYLNPNGNAGRAEVAQIIYNMSSKGML